MTSLRLWYLVYNVSTVQVYMYVTACTARGVILREVIVRGYCPGLLSDSFINSGHFYIAPSSPLLFRGAPGYSMDTVLEFHTEALR